ncbi:hypothetical protein [Yinghuangia soli]|uniref:Uncharacterized protein n=1 Tax=Yinghuangia soli TaxID=2908204 RepID=A0AA41U298_9ACTN|nr:hypothetical protein [Yinghuangia soli]MCF2531568.1 hypothetical protein [Yinghuangia soli]
MDADGRTRAATAVRRRLEAAFVAASAIMTAAFLVVGRLEAEYWWRSPGAIAIDFHLAEQVPLGAALGALAGAAAAGITRARTATRHRHPAYDVATTTAALAGIYVLLTPVWMVALPYLLRTDPEIAAGLAAASVATVGLTAGAAVALPVRTAPRPRRPARPKTRAVARISP